MTLEIVANHYGYFELRLCQNDEPMKLVEQECFDKNLLLIHGNNFENNSLVPAEESKLLDKNLTDYKYFLPSKKTGTYNVSAQLPDGVTCSHCVLQWKYHAGNNFGLTNVDKGCLGCTNRQEEFYNCADIEILEEEAYEMKKQADEALRLASKTANSTNVTTTTVSPLPTTTSYNNVTVAQKYFFNAMLTDNKRHVRHNISGENLVFSILDYTSFIVDNSILNVTNKTKYSTFSSVFIKHKPAQYEYIDYDAVLTLLNKILNFLS